MEEFEDETPSTSVISEGAKILIYSGLSILLVSQLITFFVFFVNGYFTYEPLNQALKEYGVVTRYTTLGTARDRSKGFKTLDSTDLNGRVCFKTVDQINNAKYFTSPSCMESRSPAFPNGTINPLDTQIVFSTSTNAVPIRNVCIDGTGKLSVKKMDSTNTRCNPTADFHNGGTTTLEGVVTVNGASNFNADLSIISASILRHSGFTAIRYEPAYDSLTFGGPTGYGTNTIESTISTRLKLLAPTSNTLFDGSTLLVSFGGGLGSVTGSTFYTPGAYTVTSDRRMKKNIFNVSKDDAILRLNSLSVKTYEFNDVYKSFSRDIHVNNTQVGFIAQEVIDIYPNAIYSITLGDTEYKSIDTSPIIPDLVVSHQILTANYTQLRIDYDDLKNQLDDYKSKFNTLLGLLNITLN